MKKSKILSERDVCLKLRVTVAKSLGVSQFWIQYTAKRNVNFVILIVNNTSQKTKQKARSKPKKTKIFEELFSDCQKKEFE